MLALLGILNMGGLLPTDRGFGLAGFVISMGLITFGLLSSTFHLGHPMRSWRALSQWRSSWLSREGVLAVLTYIPAALFAFGWIWYGQTGGVWAWLGLASALGAVITVYCTSMIYASLRSIPAWATGKVTGVYLALGMATGAIWLDALLRLFGEGVNGLSVLALISLMVGGALKTNYWRNIDNQTPASSIESATGLGDMGKVRLMDYPHSSANFLQKEMGYKIARKHAAKLRTISLISLFGVPIVAMLLVLALPQAAAAFAIIAVFSSSLGVIVERWLFFAEAKHVVGLYYGDDIK